ncbi:4215_t:CDS:2, partial [Acaulospora colombiana]
MLQAVSGRIFGRKEPSIREYFVPKWWIWSRANSAIPERFPINKSPSTNITATEEEVVYDLEPMRYPFKVQLIDDLPLRMIAQLEKILGEELVTPHVRHFLVMWKLMTLEEIDGKGDLIIRTTTLWYFVTEAFRIIHPDAHIQIETYGRSKDHRTIMDIRINLNSQPIILTAIMEPSAADVCASNLVELASGNSTSVFEGDLPEKFVGHEAILAKLSYQFMDNWPEGPRWALVYGGNTYVIYLMLPVLVDGIRRCVLMSSGVGYIDDTRCPFPALLLFMTLTAQMSPQNLARTLNIEQPLGYTIISDELGGDSQGVSNPLEAPALCTTRVVYLTTDLDPSGRLPFSRLPLDRLHDSSNGHDLDGNSPTFLLQHLASRNFDIVYRFNEFIVKTYLPRCEGYLENEAKVYQHLAATRASSFIPTFYGHFAYRHIKIIILSDEGPSLESFRELSSKLRTEILEALLEIHKARVVLRDFGPDKKLTSVNPNWSRLFFAREGQVMLGKIRNHLSPFEKEYVLHIDLNELIFELRHEPPRQGRLQFPTGREAAATSIGVALFHGQLPFGYSLLYDVNRLQLLQSNYITRFQGSASTKRYIIWLEVATLLDPIVTSSPNAPYPRRIVLMHRPHAHTILQTLKVPGQ